MSTALFLACLSGLFAQQAPKIQRVPVTAMDQTSGKELFQRFCVVCHGPDAKGGGPAAAALKHSPPDLTVLSKSNKGAFPSVRVQNAIEGDLLSHGTPDMPIWGLVMRGSGKDDGTVKLRVYNLAEYIEGLQVK